MTTVLFSSSIFAEGGPGDCEFVVTVADIAAGGNVTKALILDGGMKGKIIYINKPLTALNPGFHFVILHKKDPYGYKQN